MNFQRPFLIYSFSNPPEGSNQACFFIEHYRRTQITSRFPLLLSKLIFFFPYRSLFFSRVAFLHRYQHVQQIHRPSKDFLRILRSVGAEGDIFTRQQVWKWFWGAARGPLPLGCHLCKGASGMSILFCL